MAKDPDKRYATTVELAGAARDAITTPIPGQPKICARPQPPWPDPRRPRPHPNPASSPIRPRPCARTRGAATARRPAPRRDPTTPTWAGRPPHNNARLLQDLFDQASRERGLRRRRSLGRGPRNGSANYLSRYRTTGAVGGCACRRRGMTNCQIAALCDMQASSIPGYRKGNEAVYDGVPGGSRMGLLLKLDTLRQVERDFLIQTTA